MHGNTLPCITSSDAQHSTLGFIDIDTGATASSTTVPLTVAAIATDGHSLYIGGSAGGDPAEYVFAKGSRDNPFDVWKTSVPQGDCSFEVDPGPYNSLHVRDHLVWGTIGGDAYAALRDGDGSALFDHDVTVVGVTADGSRVAAARCAGDTARLDLTTDVVDGQGHHLFSGADTVMSPGMQVYDDGPPPYVTVGGDGIDPTTGEKLWHSRVPGNGGVGVSLIGHVMMGDTVDGLDAVDVRSGQPLWSWFAPSGRKAFSRVTDGERLLISNQAGGMDAVSLADGAESWSTPGTDQQPPQLYATGEGLVAVSDTTIRLFRPTGPAVAVPSITGDENTGGSGGTHLVTKCGRTPKLVPDAVRTDSGALVIRMKIVAHCPGGDMMGGSHTTITVTSGGRPVASGVFDFSKEPIVIAPGSGGGSDPFVEQEFRFPAEAWSWPPSPAGGAPPGAAPRHSISGLDVKTLVVGCDQGGSTRHSASSSADAPSSYTATGPAGAEQDSAPMDLITFDSMRDFVKAYYGELPGNVADAWPKLDSHLEHEHGHQDYVDFWSGIRSVSVRSVSARDDTSVVARLEYVRRDGSTATENRWLSFTSVGGVLRIYDSGIVK